MKKTKVFVLSLMLSMAMALTAKTEKGVNLVKQWMSIKNTSPAKLVRKERRYNKFVEEFTHARNKAAIESAISKLNEKNNRPIPLNYEMMVQYLTVKLQAMNQAKQDLQNQAERQMVKELRDQIAADSELAIDDPSKVNFDDNGYGHN